jgi:hypothetical protein
MPYKLQKAGKGWFVVKASDGTRMSKKPMSRARAVSQLQALEINVVKPEQKVAKSRNNGTLTVYKDKAGKYRWLAISSNAFRDYDGEIISTKALKDDIDNSDESGEYGTLRWWHVPNLDIGDCDYRVLYKQMLVESGTFYDDNVGKAFKENKQPLQMSIGFLHSITEPDKQGVYKSVKVFERSILPQGSAANRLTKFITTKGENDNMPALKDKLKALRKIVGNDDVYVDVIAAIEQSQKEGELSGADFKELKELGDKSDEPGVEENKAKKKTPAPKEDESDTEDESDDGEDESAEDPEEEAGETPEEEAAEEDEETKPAPKKAKKEVSTIGGLTFDEFSGVVADILTEAIAPINEKIDAITAVKEKESNASAELKKLVDAQEKTIKALQATVKELSGSTTRAHKAKYVASEEDDTVTDEIPEKIKENLKEAAPLDEFLKFAVPGSK